MSSQDPVVSSTQGCKRRKRKALTAEQKDKANTAVRKCRATKRQRFMELEQAENQILLQQQQLAQEQEVLWQAVQFHYKVLISLLIIFISING